MRTESLPAGFEPVEAVSSVLSGLSVPWWITGGWALDLAVGRVTRTHEDVDVMILERDEHALRDVPGVEVELTVGPDDEVQPWIPGQRLVAGPHRFRLRAPSLPLPTQVLLGAAVGTTWIWHRGSLSTRRSLADSPCAAGVPYLAPELVLAQKPIPPRDKDEQDLETILPLLDDSGRDWLDDVLAGRWEAHRRRTRPA